MMKIAFISRNYPPTICGIGDHTYYLAQEMMARGMDVHIICGADQKNIFSKETIYPVISNWNFVGMEALRQVLKNIQPDWVIVQYEAYAFNVKGFPYAFLSLYRSMNKSKIPVLTVFHEVMIRSEGSLKNRILSFLQHKLSRLLYHLSTKVVTSIDLYARWLSQNPDKLTIIPVGSNILPVDVQENEQKALKEKYKINNDAKIICTFGNRDVSPYLSSFDKLKTDFPDFVWLICGKTSTPLSILNSRDYIRHTGKMSAYDIHRHLALGDVFFMPDYVSEKGEGGSCNKSGTLACAFSLNIPIVGTKGDMNNALLKDGENILLTDTLSTQNALYENLKLCLSSKKRASDLGNQARDLYEKALSWQVIATQILEIMTPLSKKAPSSTFQKNIVEI